VKSAKGVKDTKQVGKVKKVQPNKGKSVKKDIVRPVTKTNKSSSAKASTVNQKKAQRVSKAKGNVQTYKSADFKSSLNNLLTKGGSLSKVRSASTGNAGSVGNTALSTSSIGAQAEMSKVSNQIGSISGSTDGKLDRTKGTGGIFDKGNIYTAGLPYKTVVLGGLDPDVIRQILIANIPQFRGCYQSEINRQNRAFDGRVLLNFIIGASGYVSKASVDSMSTLPIPVKNCVVNVLKGIKFPKPLGGGRVEVNQPFNFYPRIK
jgi:outer membrane biosynthesis protein TonB